MKASSSRRALVIGAALVAAGLVVFWILRAPAAAFRARVAELRAAGFATTCPEFIAPDLPEGEWAAAELQAAWSAMLRSPGRPDGYETGIAGPWDISDDAPWHASATPERMAALRDWLEKARPYFDRVSGAVQKGPISFARTADEFGRSQASDIPVQHGLVRTLVARARAAPDPADEVAACRDLLRLGRGVRAAEPVGLFVAYAAEVQGLVELRDGVAEGRLDAARCLAGLGADLTPRPPGDRERYARGGVASTAETWEAVLRGWNPPDPFASMRKPSTLDSIREALHVPRSDGLFDGWGSRSMTRILDHYATLARDADAWPRATDPPAGDPVLEAGRKIAVRFDLRRRRLDAAHVLARLALLVRVHRDQTGAWPASLRDVDGLPAGAVSSDPSTGVQFVYEIRGTGVRLASAGRAPSDGPSDETDEDLAGQGLIWDLPAPSEHR